MRGMARAHISLPGSSALLREGPHQLAWKQCSVAGRLISARLEAELCCGKAHISLPGSSALLREGEVHMLTRM